MAAKAEREASMAPRVLMVRDNAGLLRRPLPGPLPPPPPPPEDEDAGPDPDPGRVSLFRELLLTAWRGEDRHRGNKDTA
jgi:hypothetical protein